MVARRGRNASVMVMRRPVASLKAICNIGNIGRKDDEHLYDDMYGGRR